MTEWTDCPNAEIRDQLPDLVHDRLDASARAIVSAHVAGCEDCRAELELLRSVRGALVAATPRVNIDKIVAALPKAGVAPQVQRRATARYFTTWRIAAAVTFLAVGSGTYAVVSREQSAPVSSVVHVADAPPTVPGAPGVQTPAPAPASAPRESLPSPARGNASTPAAPVTEVVADAADGIAGTSRLGDLSQKQLKALVSDIDRMQALPLADPEPVSIKVDTRTAPAAPEGGVR